MALTVDVLGGLSATPLGTVTLDPDFDVADLKWEIEKKHGISEQEQRLVLDGKVLSNNQVLSDVFEGKLQAEVRLVRLDPRWVRTLQGVQSGRISLLEVDEELRGDREVMLAAVRRDPAALRHATGGLQADRELALLAVQHGGRSLEFVAPELRADREVVLAAVRNEGLAVRFAARALQANLEVARAAVRQNGWALELMCEEMRGNREIVYIAVEQEGQAIKHVVGDLQNERELVLTAVRSNAEALRHIPQELKQDPEIVRAASMGVRMRGFGGLQYFQNLLR